MYCTCTFTNDPYPNSITCIHMYMYRYMYTYMYKS